MYIASIIKNKKPQYLQKNSYDETEWVSNMHRATLFDTELEAREWLQFDFEGWQIISNPFEDEKEMLESVSKAKVQKVKMSLED